MLKYIQTVFCSRTALYIECYKSVKTKITPHAIKTPAPLSLHIEKHLTEIHCQKNKIQYQTTLKKTAPVL